MKLAALLWMCWFGSLQSLSFDDCCCGSLCKHRGEVCTDCGHKDTRVAPKAPRPSPGPRSGC